MNQSMSSNHTGGHGRHGNRASMRQVAHNHTYPLQPGQSPKETMREKKAAAAAAGGSSGESRDTKRVKANKLPFTMDEIIDSSVEHFTELLQKYSLTDAQLQLVKDIRRRGKNKVAAQNCRKRKMEVIVGLEGEVLKMKAERDRLLAQRRAIDKEFGSMKEKYGHLYAEVFRSLRDENGQPYDPSQYALQHTGDGNVFLIPRTDNNRPANEHKEKSSRKRKSQKHR